MKQSSCLGSGYQSSQKLRLGSSMCQSRVLPQDLINTLPEACLAEIFRHLENPEDRQSCASVCWRWADVLVSQRQDFWGPFSVHQAVHHCLHLFDVDDAKLVAAVVGIPARDVVTDADICHGPRDAVAGGALWLTDNAIRFITSACCKLKSVCLINCLSLTNKAAWIIASKCPALENLVMLHSSISDDGLSQVAKKCTNLKSLHIEGSLSITEASLRALVLDAKRLESLTLGSCPHIGEDAILSFLMNQPYLDKLELKGMMSGESHWSGARQSSALHRHFGLFGQLSTLILVKCPGLQDLGMLKFARNIPFQMLQHLVIDDCRGVTERGLRWLVGDAMNPMKLKTIKLASVDEVMFQKCWKLKLIRMEHCGRIMYHFFAWVSVMCSGLKEIRLIGSPAPFQDKTAWMLSAILHSSIITKIELRSCHVTDKDVCTIAQVGLEALQELILDECPEILGNFTVFLRSRCPNLIKLSLNRVRINDDHVESLVVFGFEHLEEINLIGSSSITDRILLILDESPLPKLVRVNLSDCPNVTQETVDEYRCFYEWEIEN